MAQAARTSLRRCRTRPSYPAWITGYHKVRKGDGEEGYHQSLIDITPARVLEELNQLLLAGDA